jgi:hypothetical protein
MMKKMHRVDVANASHRQPAYFEWFYFHFVTDDGAALNMVLHETDIFGLKQQPYLSLSMLLPGQEPCYLRRDLAGVEMGRERPFLQVGEEGWTYHFMRPVFWVMRPNLQDTGLKKRDGFETHVPFFRTHVSYFRATVSKNETPKMAHLDFKRQFCLESKVPNALIST